MDVERQQADNFYQNLFEYSLDSYRRRRFCDVKLFARPSCIPSDRLQSVSCHALVLCSVAPMFKHLLQSADVDPEEATRCVYLPSLTIEAVSKFLDDLYTGLCDREFVLDVGQDLADAFGMLLEEKPHDERPVQVVVAAQKLDESKVIVAQPKNSSDKVIVDPAMKKVFYTASEWKRDKERWENEKRAAQKPRQRMRKSGVPEGEITGLRSLGHSRIPVVRKIDIGPCKYSKDVDESLNVKVEDLTECLSANQGCIVASVAPFYTTSSVTDDRSNVLANDPLKQFRMKLPESKIVAFMAVGVKDGLNYASVLAMTDPKFDRRKSYQNLIEATKRVCGTSYGLILRHKRIMDGRGDCFSEAATDAAREELLGMPLAERQAVLQESKSFVDELDAEVDPVTFHHLPLHLNSSLQFRLTPDVESFEVLDYALLDAEGSIRMRSFFQFSKIRVTNQRAVTIMLDTISCFVGCGNVRPIHGHPFVSEAMDGYAKKTCNLLSCQSTGTKRPRKKCLKILSNTYLEKPAADDAADKGRKRKAIRRSNLTDGDPGDERKPYQCKYAGCSRGFDKITEMAGHVARVHGKRARMAKALHRQQREPQSCQECGKAVRSAKDMRDHVYYHHTRKTCVWCNIEFPGAYLFYYHNNKVHYERLECDVCHQVFKGREKLRVHKINKHLEDHEKPYVCGVCGKGYAAKTKLQSHQMNVHIRSRPFKCRLEGCDADFNELANRNAHERGVHKFSYKDIVDMGKNALAAPEQLISDVDPTVRFVQMDETPTTITIRQE